MSIAVIGTGGIGRVLGRAFATAGHKVVFGSRDPGVRAEVAQGTTARVTTVAEALEGAEIVVLAQPGRVVDDFLAEHGAALDGVLVVDAANRFGDRVMHSSEQLADRAPGARYARAFNMLAVENFEQPLFDGVAADLFFSTSAADRGTVEALISAVGLRPAYIGPDKYDLLDAMLSLWASLAIDQGRGRHLAFRVLSDESQP